MSKRSAASRMRRQLSPTVKGILAAGVLAPVFALAWYAASFVLALYAGATFGGYGAAAHGPTVRWFRPVIAGLALVAILADLGVGWTVAHHARSTDRTRTR